MENIFDLKKKNLSFLNYSQIIKLLPCKKSQTLIY